MVPCMLEQPSAEAGVFCNLFTLYIPVRTVRTAYDGKIIAICAALEQLFCFLDKFTDVIILSNLQAALCSVESVDSPSSGNVLKCQNSTQKLHQPCIFVAFQGISSHCGIMGNERTNTLAKMGILI